MEDRKHVFLALIFLCLAFFPQAQTPRIDSLENAFNQEKDLYDKGQLAIHLLEMYANKNTDKAFYYGLEALSLAERGLRKNDKIIRFKALKGKVYFNLAALNHKMANFDSAKAYYLRAIPALKEGNDKALLAKNISYLGRIYEREGDRSEFLRRTRQAVHIQESIQDSIGMAYSLISLGDYHARLNEFDSCLKNYDRALNILRSGKDLRSLSFCLQNLGGMHKGRGEYGLAIDYFFEALAIQEKRDDKSGMVYTLINIGSLHKLMREFDKAEDYYAQASLVNKDVQDQSITAKLFYNRGDMKALQDKPREAIRLYRKALTIMRKIDIGPNVIANCLNDISRQLFRIGNHNEALTLVNEALEVGKGISLPNDQVARHLNKASIELELNQVSESERQLDTAIEMCLESKLKKQLKDAYFLKSKIEEKKGKYKSAIQYLKKFQTLNDSLNLASTEKLLLQKEAAHQINKSKQEKEIALKKVELLKKDKKLKNGILGAVVGLVLLVSLISLLLFKNYKQKKDAQGAEVMNKLNRSNSELSILRERVNSLLISENSQLEKIDVNQNVNEFLDEPLSQREMDVLQELTTGKSNQEISDVLFISVNTVRTHLLNIYNKLDVKNRTQAVKKAANLNLVQ